MTIRVRFTSVDPSDAVVEHVRRRARFALGRFVGRVRAVAVSIRDLNGPRGGRDKHCTVRVSARGAGTIVVRETTHDVYQAVDRGLRRAAFVLARSAARASRPPRGPVAPVMP